MVSGGFEGDIKLWDIRETNSIRTIQAHTHNEMAALAVHDHSPVIARLDFYPPVIDYFFVLTLLFSAGDDQVIKVWSMEGNRLSTIRPSSGFLGQKSASTRALTFHPNLMVMAASGTDGHITVSFCL